MTTTEALKMARDALLYCATAAEADLEMAMELASALEALSSRWGATMPEKIAKPQRDEDESEGFSLDGAG